MDNLKGKTVSLAHGAGGKQTSELIDQVFKAHFANPELTSDDAAVLKMKEGKIAFTTDGFIVSPSEFPGGNIGKLSICGTVNDLSCMGAKPLYLSCLCFGTSDEGTLGNHLLFLFPLPLF